MSSVCVNAWRVSRTRDRCDDKARGRMAGLWTYGAGIYGLISVNHGRSLVSEIECIIS